MTIYFSFIRKNLLNPELTGFAGFENYRYLWEDPAFVPAITNSIILIGAVLIITVVLGTLFAVLFDREFFGKNMATLLVIAPFFVMPTVSALIWKNMMMHPVYGFFAVFDGTSWGCSPSIGLARIPLLINHHHCFLGVAAFAFLILFTSIKSLDQEQKEAAARRRRESGAVLLLRHDRAPEPCDRGRRNDRNDLSVVDFRRDLHDDLGRTGNGNNEPCLSGVFLGPSAV